VSCGNECKIYWLISRALPEGVGSLGLKFSTNTLCVEGRGYEFGVNARSRCSLLCLARLSKVDLYPLGMVNSEGFGGTG
jgi:hypothetical protein